MPGTLPERVGRCIGHGVVHEYAEAGETHHRQHAAGQQQQNHDGGHGQFGGEGHRVASADPGKRTRQVTFPGHGHRRAPYPGNERQQCSEGPGGSSALHEGGAGSQPRVGHGFEKRGRR